MSPDRERFGIYCGLAAPVVFMILYTIAAFGDPEYEFFRNYLSDLGVGNMALFFNTAVIVAGGLTIPFACLAVRPVVGGGNTATLAVILTVVAGVFLILVGVFTEDFDGTHFIVSIGFFISFLAALFFYSWTLHYSNALGKRITVFTELAFFIGLLLTTLGFNPATETVSVLIIIFWALVIAITLLLRGADADTY
jgi:hypothetical membrane protein